MNCRYLGGEQVPGKKSQVKKMNITPLPYLVATKSIRGRDLKHSLGLLFCDHRSRPKMDLVATKEDRREAVRF